MKNKYLLAPSKNIKISRIGRNKIEVNYPIKYSSLYAQQSIQERKIGTEDLSSPSNVLTTQP